MTAIAAAALGLSLLVAAVPAPCADPAGERAALMRAAGGDLQFTDVAAALERRCGAPLAAGIRLTGPASEAAATLADRLDAFCARANAQGTASAKPDSREALARILSRPEFAQSRTPDVNGLTRLAAWITSWLDALFETSGAQSFAFGTRVLVLALAIALVLGVGFRLATSRRRFRTPRPEGAGDSAALKLETPEIHLARAGSALEADPRAAIREGLFALLSSLERRSLARPDRVKTNREVAEQLAERGAAPQLAERVRSLLGWYDRTYYSLERPGAPDARRFVDEVSALSRTLREEPA